MTARLLIVGASARAAAESAHRAGFQVNAIDLFGDQDLCRIANVIRCHHQDYPSALPRLAAQFPASPFCYVGGLENHPSVVEELQAVRPLRGVSPQSLPRCRDPWQLAALAAHHGLRFPAIQSTPPDGSSWLRKPFASAGGLGVRECDSDSTRTSARPSGTHYYQTFVPGPVCSGWFLADDRTCRLWGVSRQLTVRELSAPGPPFAYAGSVGPLPLDPDTLQEWSTWGAVLWEHFGLRGLFGIDAVCANERGEAPWLLEINPRFTASMELWDHAGPSGSVMGCWLAPIDKEPPRRTSVAGKLVLYARRNETITLQWLDALRGRLRAGEWLADIPQVPQTIAGGQPIATLMITGTTSVEVEQRIEQLARDARSC